MTQFAIVRHGVTDWNIEGRMQGHIDIPLNDIGNLQAQRIADRLSLEPWDIIVSSDLRRAAQTAKCIADTVGIEYRLVDPRLRERYFGRLEGTTLAEREAEWGTNWSQLDNGIEKDDALLARALQTMEQLASDYRSKHIVIVSHGGWIRQFFNTVFPHEILDHPNNTSLTIVRRDSEGWQYSLYNCTNHLNSEPIN